MEIEYKFILETEGMMATPKKFKKVFFINHLTKFLNGKLMLMISPDLQDHHTLLQFDIDYKLNETTEPDMEIMRVYKALSEAFHPLEFNLEITPGGGHIVSNFNYIRLHEMLDTKKFLKSYFDRVKNLDIDASFRPTPLKRIGYDKSKGFWYTPVHSINSNIRNKLFNKRFKMSELFWTDYIEHKLLGNEISISFESMRKSLEKFHEILGKD